MTLTSEQKQHIYNLREEGKTIDQICSITGHSKRAVEKYSKNPDISYKENIAPGRGRTRALSDEQVQYLDDLSKSHKKLGSKRLTPLLNKDLNTSITDRTVRNYRAELDLHWEKPKRKWVLSEQAKQNRVKWARNRMNKTDWDKWVFSDETSIDYSGIHGQTVKGDEKPIVEKNSRTPKVSVWWAISTKWTFKHFIYTHRQNGETYVEKLKQAIPPQRIRFMDNDWVFQQDNSGVHTSQYVREWLEGHFPNYCKDWPSYSPDLNPIENVWNIVKEQVTLRDPQNLEQLTTAITDIIEHIPQTTISTLIHSMDRRLKSCIDHAGAHTKY
jgi:transposase